MSYVGLLESDSEHGIMDDNFLTRGAASTWLYWP